MVINHNMGSVNANRMMGVNQSNASKSMEKLSSGLRINRAGDDAAGLAISEKMRAQIRGLDQAAANGQDGISMIQTAEGALGETHSILQRMRELSVQASNDTNVTVDRNEIQKEMDELTKEVTRISNNTEFNTQKLINGGISDEGIKSAKFHIGANANQDITLSINAMDAKSLGLSRDVISADLDDANLAGVASAQVDSVDVKKTLADGDYKVVVSDDSAGATVEAFATGITGVTVDAAAPSAEFAVTFTYHAAKTDGTGTAGTATIADTNVTNGATALTATRSDVIDAADAGSYEARFTDATTYDVFKSDGAGGFNSVATGITVGTPDVETAIAGVTLDIAAATGGAYAGGDKIAFTITADTTANWATSATSGDTFSKSYAVGDTVDANGVTITLADTGAAEGEIVNVTGGTTKVQLTTANDVEIGEADYISKSKGGSYIIGDETVGQAKITFAAGEASDAGATTITVGTTDAKAAEKSGDTMTDATVEGGLNVSTQQSASESITTIQKAIETVSAERSKLGAYQNRLEHTISNLGTSSENLTSAESRIRDVDMAKEMSTFSKNNILAQAAQSMLAQANQQPQQVLQLLQ